MGCLFGAGATALTSLLSYLAGNTAKARGVTVSGSNLVQVVVVVVICVVNTTHTHAHTHTHTPRSTYVLTHAQHPYAQPCNRTITRTCTHTVIPRSSFLVYSLRIFADIHEEGAQLRQHDRDGGDGDIDARIESTGIGHSGLYPGLVQQKCTRRCGQWGEGCGDDRDDGKRHDGGHQAAGGRWQRYPSLGYS